MLLLLLLRMECGGNIDRKKSVKTAVQFWLSIVAAKTALNIGNLKYPTHNISQWLCTQITVVKNVMCNRRESYQLDAFLNCPLQNIGSFLTRFGIPFFYLDRTTDNKSYLMCDDRTAATIFHWPFFFYVNAKKMRNIFWR